jgi:hypothetical protein
MQSVKKRYGSGCICGKVEEKRTVNVILIR